MLAAIVEGTRQVAVDPDTGTLRGDLLRLGQQIHAHVSTHASTIRAVLVEVSRSAELAAMMQEQFFDQRKALMSRVLTRAVDRCEIEASAVSEEILGCVARLPDLPLGADRPGAVRSHDPGPRRQPAAPRPHPP